MKITVFGGSGNIGTAVVRHLTDDGHRVSVATRRVTDNATELAPGVPWRPVDLAEDSLEPVIAGADAVVHLSWLFQPSHRRSVTWRNNVVGMRRLLAAMEQVETPALVYSSSIAAYSPRVDLRPVREDWPTDGASPAAYAREKAYIERLLDAFECRNAGRRVVRMRPAFVFQRSSATQQRRLFAGPFAPRSLIGRRKLPVVPAPRALRLQTVHTDDVAAAFAAALHRDVRGAFNLAADRTLGPADLATLLGGRHVPVPAGMIHAGLSGAWRAHLAPAPPDLWDALMSLPVMSTARAKSELGWQPQASSADALDEFLDGLREGAGAPTPPLDPDTGGPLRSGELGTGVGEKP